MMFTMPVYDMMLLPGVTFYFKKDIFQQMGNQDAKAGDDVLFLMQRTDKDRKDLTPEDFYPVGVSGKLDSVDNEGNIRIRTVARVDLSDLEMAEDGILANASIRPDTEDITPEEEKAIFDRVKNILLNYISQFQWGVLARNYVLHWKNLEETLCAVSGYIHIPWEDKYRIIETDSRKERCELHRKSHPGGHRGQPRGRGGRKCPEGKQRAPLPRGSPEKTDRASAAGARRYASGKYLQRAPV